MFHIPGLYLGQMLPDVFFCPIPPFQFKQQFNGSFRKALSYRFCRNAADDGIWRNVLCNDSASPDNGAVSNRNACQNDCFIANPDIISDNNIALIILCICNILCI